MKNPEFAQLYTARDATDLLQVVDFTGLPASCQQVAASLLNSQGRRSWGGWEGGGTSPLIFGLGGTNI